MSERAEFIRKISMLVLYAYINGIKVVPFTFYRNTSQQKILFEKGLSKCDGVKTVSKHQKWLAIDFYIEDDKGNPIWHRTPEYELLGMFWENLGGTWGGDFKTLDDIYHFEL